MNTKFHHTHACQGTGKNRQRGVVLVISLIILLVMTLIGITAMQTTSQEERMASNMRQRNLAFQAAEAGLRVGETLIRSGTLPVFNNSTPGLRQLVIPTTDVGTYWMNTYNWGAESQLYGSTLDSTLAEQPRYVIEEMPTVGLSGGSLKFGTMSSTLYRVTARGVGGTPDAVVLLQTTYR